MATTNLLGNRITNLDASPIVADTEGEYGPGRLRVVSDYVTALSADDTSSDYTLVRIPTTAKIKSVWIASAIATAGSGDINVCHSDSTTDGTPASLQGAIVQISAADNKLFGAAQSLVLAGARTDFTFAGTFTAQYQNMPLWEVLVDLGADNFTEDPGGFFDLRIDITTTVTTGGVVSMEVYYVE